MNNVIQVLVNALALGGFYALTALAIGLVFGVMRLINFAQGEYMTIGAYALVVPTVSVAPPLLLGAWPSPLMIAAVMLLAAGLAYVTERVAFRPLRNSSPSTLLISSFAVSYFLQHLVILVHTGRPKSVGIGDALTKSVDLGGGIFVPGVQLATLVVTGVLLLSLVLFLKKTPLGIQMRAAAENFEMARLLGIPANRVISIAFIISGLLAGASALLIVVQTGTLDIRMGVMPVIYAFFATVIGGMGSLPGAALGGFLVGVISALLQSYLPMELRPLRDAGVFAVVILILLVRPQGLIVTLASRERI